MGVKFMKLKKKCVARFLGDWKEIKIISVNFKRYRLTINKGVTELITLVQ